MILAGAKDARTFGSNLAGLLIEGKTTCAYDAILPYLKDKNPFRLLDILAVKLKEVPLENLLPFLEQIADGRFEGGWVVIATALFQHITGTPDQLLTLSTEFVRQADVWYAADIFGERVAGPYLLSNPENALILLSAWRADPNPWVRRVCGVAAHFWAKRSRGENGSTPTAENILRFLLPLLEETDIRAAKGIGWGLKTMGRYYPKITAAWLREQLLDQGKQPLAVVRRKALKFLPNDLKKGLSS